MRIRSVDDAGDFTFGKGLNNYAEQDREIAQDIRCRLLSWEGDCFWALRDGIDWRNLLDKGQEVALEFAIKSTILQTAGVASITQLSLVLGADRKLSITYSIETIYGNSFQSTINQGI
jgi:hypothetical protein